jgi:hypothetical protein
MFRVTFLDTDDFAFDHDLRQQVASEVTAAELVLRPLLPLADLVNVTLYPSRYVIPETGEAAFTSGPSWIQVTVDPWRDEGPSAILAKHLKPTLFHEAHHAARMRLVMPDQSILGGAVFEGLANVFARDLSGSTPPWAEYDGLPVDDWIEDLKRASWSERPQWFFDHPDGRRWVGYRAGTCLVDRAIAQSGKSATDFVGADTATILRFAGLDPA